MKKIIYLIIIIIFTAVFASGTVENPDKPSRGVWDLKLKKVWQVEKGGEELLIKSGMIRVDNAENVFIMELKHGKIFVFDKEGKFLNTIGKRGEGPGEFRMAFSFFLVDKYVVVPGMGGIFHYFQKDGKFVKTVNTGFFVFPRAFLDKNRFIMVKSDREGMGKDPEKISIYNMKTKKSVNIKEISPEKLLTASKGGMRLVIKDSQTTAGVVLTLSGKNILYGKSDKYLFSKIDQTGKELMSFSIKGRERKKISEKFKRKRFENIIMNGGRMPKDMVDQMVKGMPDVATYFSRIWIDQNGLIYVFVTDLENESGQEIDIFSPEGKYLYHVNMNLGEGYTISSSIVIQSNFLYLFAEDEDDEAALFKYKIDLPK
ncbi:MAG: 6-bladed beta-propeller [Acidobacteriota bacterium]